jgi:predicted DsbA family dithiol-disulfide isomerase
VSLSVDVVSDVACPWCFIGKRKLETALALAPDLGVTVHWRPYQLDPTLPPEGIDRRDYLLAKFGSEERLNEIHERIEATGRENGIHFDFDAMKRASNTLDAHRLIRWADSTGKQDAVVEALFSANFEQGRDIGDRTVLLEIAREAGLDTAVIEALLHGNADADAVEAEVETARGMGITGVPCFLLDGRYALMGAQEAAVLADALRRVAAEG